jgi:tungstate transport system ATP-binding protein
MSSSIYRLENICKWYAGRCVLKVDHLEIRPGEVFAIVGPNGAGKSTLLRLLNFLEPFDEGNLYFQGQSITFPASLNQRRQVSMVFQRPILFDRSVMYNVVYGVRLRGWVDSDFIRPLLEELDLQDLTEEATWSLSGGQAQRVALARTLALQTPVVLLDEPTANLDPYNVKLIEAIVGRLRREGRRTIILVTHNIFQARRLADRVLMLLGGEMIEVAEPSKLIENPTDPRTKAFVHGEMVY